ncbi:MAG: site-specific DNA-methyltransferase [Pirellulales bacterium]|nr:site-specific DNA-methyltransferase [Pirellulales bacterium]
MSGEIVQGDCRQVLKKLAGDYFSACITDPPYNYEFIGRDWDEREIERRVARVRDSKTLVKNIPYGSGLAGGVRNKRWYQRVRENIVENQQWCESWGHEVYRTMRPGSYILVFNSTRTIAHVQVALENAGFYARDILVYRRHAGIPKGLNYAKKLQKNGDPDWQQWKGWHSCLRNEWEAICMLQKPLIGNYMKTLDQFGVGLMRANSPEEDGFLSNIIDGVRRESIPSSDVHCTVKPLELIDRLIKLVVPSSGGHVVLDPFVGSGTTCVSAKRLGHGYVGIDISAKYCEHARQRLLESASRAGQEADLSQKTLFV